MIFIFKAVAIKEKVHNLEMAIRLVQRDLPRATVDTGPTGPIRTKPEDVAAQTPARSCQ